MIQGKNDISKAKIFQSVLISGIIGIGLLSFATAARKVSIPIQEAAPNANGNTSLGVDLYNGSGVAVNYNIACYNKSGSVTFSKSALTLNPKTSTNHAGPVKCADNSEANKYNFLNNMVSCGNTDYANAASKCASGYTMCSLTAFQSNVGSSSGYTSFWVDFSSEMGSSISTSSGASNNFQYSTDNGYYWSTSYNNYIIAGSQNSAYKCRTSSGATEFANCNGNYVTPTYSYATACCPSGGATIELPSASCEVEILSTTPAAGFLQSPQFKGSAAF